MYTYLSKKERDTISFAKKMASKIEKGDIIVLSGELGAGKTKFMQGVLTFFSLENEISSPTFTIVNEYQTQKLNLYHFDVYRLEDIDEFYGIGGDEYFEKGACIIEWGELITEVLPPKYIIIEIKKDNNDENSRLLNIYIKGENKKWSDFFEDTCN